MTLRAVVTSRQRRSNMQTTFKSLFDIYPDKISKGAVVGYRKADGTPLEFPCTLDTGDAVIDAKGRWTASSLGLKPVVAKYSKPLGGAGTREAWIGDGFCASPNGKSVVGNKTLEHVRFVDGVTSIVNHAFACCTGLASVTIPDGVTSIGARAFACCFALTDITIPDSVTRIGNGAFSYCSVLTGITIPESVTEIEDYAFWGCTGLTDVYVDQQESDLFDNADLPEGCAIHWKQTEAA